MASVPRVRTKKVREIHYPTRDGKPMGETELHRRKMADLIETLDEYYAANPNVYVAGNLLVFYEEGNPKRHISPDVFVVRGVPKQPYRDHYLIWLEAKPPELVIEVTSRTTRREDQHKKKVLYHDTMKVFEYFLFDPREEYLKPPFQGFRRIHGDYVPIPPVDGRLPSEVLGLHLERSGTDLRLYDPKTRLWLPTPREHAGAERERAEHEKGERLRMEAELERLRGENERLRSQLGRKD